MNNATDRRLPPELLARFATFESPLGRRRLQLYLERKRMLWRCTIAGAHTAKRALDLVGSGCALALLSPLFLTIALAIKLEDRGPVIFRQVRVGQRGIQRGRKRNRRTRVRSVGVISHGSSSQRMQPRKATRISRQ